MPSLAYFSTAHIEFQALRSTAVGIHPIRATIKIRLVVSVSGGATRASAGAAKPLARAAIKAISVEISRAEATTFNIFSSRLYLPMASITIHTTNTMADTHSVPSCMPNSLASRPAVTNVTAAVTVNIVSNDSTRYSTSIHWPCFL